MKFSTNLALDASSASLLSSNIQPITIDEQSRVVYRSIQRNRQAICPYISSTFSDLEEEFKHLHLDTFVKLKQISKSHGCHFDPVDYRRTAIDFRSTSDYILKNALDVIDQTIPFFICIIGNTYGPHISENAPCLKLPNNDNIKTQAFSTTERNLLFAASHGHPWVLDVEVQKCSLMELEILAACFLENSAISRHCFFYIKDFYPHLLKTGGNSFNQDTVLQPDYIQEIGTVFEAESDYAQGRLNNLKQLIINKGLPVKYFTSKEVLGNAILNDWTEVITRLYPSLPKYVLQGDEILTSTWSQQSLMGFLQNGYVSYPSEEKIRNDLFNFSQAVSKYIPNAKNQVADDTEKMAVESEDIIGFKTGDGIFTTANSFIETIRHCESKERAASKQVFVLVGDPGIGKSALLANWMHDFKGVFPEVLVISEFVGSSYLSYDASAFCRKCIHKLREKSWNKRVYGMDGISDSTSFSGLVETFSACLELVPCLLVIDGLNDVCYGMGEDIGKIKGLEWLPEALPSNCLMVVSTRRSDLTYKALKKRRDTHFQFMPSIDVKTRERIFKRLYRPDAIDVLGRDLVDKVWTNRLSERPLFLMTLSDLLRSCRSQRDVTQVVEKCTALRTFRDFWKSVFVLWSRRHSWSKHQSSGQPGSVRNRSNASGWVADALKFIASSRGGLTLHELIHLLFLMGYRGRSTVTPHDWNLFRCTAGSALRLADDGLIVIAHEDIKLAVEYFLLGKGKYSATATTTGSNQNVELHFHHLLGSYFLKYGSMQRKMVELPWQLMQGNDFTSLFQILCKSRFFLEMCVESLNRPSLHADHKLYWQKLDQHDFSIVQCFQLMISQATEEQSSFLESKESRRTSVATGAHDSRFKQLVGMILKAPSMIIVTQHEEGSAPSLHRSTDDSRSETEERDFSETESFSFFITEPEADHHHLSVGGWSPIQDDPEKTIATGLLDADDQSRLRLNVAYFLFQLGNDYHEEACRQVEELRENLENSRPLSSVQQLTLVELAHLEGLNLPEHKPDILKQALDTYRQLTLQTMDLGYNRLRNLMQIKGELLLQLSRSMIDDGEYAHSHPLIEKAFEAMHKCGSVCGQALGETVFAMFLHLQGMSSEAEEITLRGLDTFIRWHGGMHLSVAVALCDLAHIYKTSQQNDEVLNRKAMLALKQALHIYDFNEKKLEAAEVANQIGGLLTEENTLRSKVEADECFGRALDTFVTTPSKNNGVKVRKINMGRKKTGGDLKLGRFIHGSAKPLDTRRPERPFSSLSWHTSELSKLSICNQSVVPLPSPSRSEKLVDRPSSIRPYSPFSTKSVGNCVLVTPRNQHMRRVQSASVYSYGRRSEMSPSQSSKRVLSGKHPASEKTQELPRYLSDGVDREQIEVVEGREVPVVIVPGGRNSRLSIKLDLEDWERTSRHLGDDPDDHLYLTEMSGRSEASSAFKRRLPTAKTDYQRSPIHRSHCLYRSGPDNLCLTVHGPHSLISDVLHPSPSPRPVVKATGVSHESAWYHVPGRYATPEAILPPKRNQKRPSTAGSSRHSVATTYHDTARSDSYHSVLRTSSAAMRRHLASQQSSRGIAESTIHEEYLAANFNDDERQLHHS